MSDQQAPNADTETDVEFWHTIRRGWVLHLEGAGNRRLTLLPGDAARLAMLLREAQPPEAGTSGTVHAYRAAQLGAASGDRRRAGLVDRLRTALAQWLYDFVSP